VIDRVPPKAAQYYARFSVCRICNGIFWEGSHWQRMSALVAGLGIGTPSVRA
jgi:uncharacterized protein with PIN domain